ncbi:Lipoprotein [Methylophaga frappieri]|uniref:Lipoprotein n=1 Tax=Methylophaga frappieri (strain ATCC BAA-2434 / DSM 25690 / JAM7) TaxID=754477 RepID=I1YIA8_METFJ|nr:VacJ family lipoprotein [Methylophaga frappieri]AFJ02651.1 Lipoprotein [Methylophaga frappieri]
MTHDNLFRRFGFIALLALMTGCASTSNNPQDPYESYNRAMYKFNDTLDKAVIKPVAQGYDAVVPDPISWGVSNFFSNLNEITVIINDLLQGKFEQAAHDTGRFALNTTVGVFGIFDVAGHAGHKKNNEDFGQTLGVWGVEPGAYVVLPFFGPRTVRDSFGLVGDMFTDPVMYVEGDDARLALAGLRVIDTRANLLKASKIVSEASDDEYAYIRDAYLQRRQYLVHDGNPPTTDDDFDLFDDL